MVYFGLITFWLIDFFFALIANIFKTIKFFLSKVYCL